MGFRASLGSLVGLMAVLLLISPMVLQAFMPFLLFVVPH